MVSRLPRALIHKCAFCKQALLLPLPITVAGQKVILRTFSEISRFLWFHRYLQSRMGLPDAWPLLSLQQARGRARGNEYQPSNIKRKHKHGWIRRLSTPAGVQVILRRMLKGRKSLSH